MGGVVGSATKEYGSIPVDRKPQCSGMDMERETGTSPVPTYSFRDSPGFTCESLVKTSEDGHSRATRDGHVPTGNVPTGPRLA